MTWEEIGRKYDREKANLQLLERTPKLEKEWGRLVRSTDQKVTVTFCYLLLFY